MVKKKLVYRVQERKKLTGLVSSHNQSMQANVN